MKRNKIFLMALAIILAAALVNCGKAEDNGGSNPDATVNLRAAAVQGEWVYHFKMDRSSAEAVSGLYKTRLDNSETILVSKDLGLFLTVEGDWIYYSTVTPDDTDSIYKVKTDGTGRTQLADDAVLYSMSGKGFQLEGDWFYYLSADDERALHRVKTDGSAEESLAESVMAFYVQDGWIYYTGGLEAPKLYKMKTDGSENGQLLDENGILLDVSEEAICFWDEYESGNWIKRADLDGSDVEKLELDSIYLLKEKDGWIYYITEPDPDADNQIYRVKTDGSGKEKLTDDNSFFLTVQEDWIYYISMDWDTGTFWLNRMKQDRSGTENFKAEGILVFLNW